MHGQILVNYYIMLHTKNKRSKKAGIENEINIYLIFDEKLKDLFHIYPSCETIEDINPLLH